MGKQTELFAEDREPAIAPSSTAVPVGTGPHRYECANRNCKAFEQPVRAPVSPYGRAVKCERCKITMLYLGMDEGAK